MLNRSYSYKTTSKYKEKTDKINKSLISFKTKSTWKPKGNYNMIKALSKEIEYELKKIEKVKRNKLEIDDRYLATKIEYMNMKRNHESYINNANTVIRSYSNKLKHSGFNKEVV